MKLFIAPAWMRLFLFLGGALLWLGIWHTGFAAASWILYLPAAMFVFAAATGICPGAIVSRQILPPKEG
jgi:hypothetical protein